MDLPGRGQLARTEGELATLIGDVAAALSLILLNDRPLGLAWRYAEVWAGAGTPRLVEQVVAYTEQYLRGIVDGGQYVAKIVKAMAVEPLTLADVLALPRYVKLATGRGLADHGVVIFHENPLAVGRGVPPPRLIVGRKVEGAEVYLVANNGGPRTVVDYEHMGVVPYVAYSGHTVGGVEAKSPVQHLYEAGYRVATLLGPEPRAVLGRGHCEVRCYGTIVAKPRRLPMAVGDTCGRDQAAELAAACAG